LNSLLILALSFAYLGLLFAVAWWTERGDSQGRTGGPRMRSLAYALSLAVYCTSWTFFGTVGTAARSGWDYLPIYIGPSLALTLMFPVWKRIAVAAKRQNTGSIADFLAARYGKSQAVGALVAMVAMLGALPYIALQLRSLTQVAGLLTGGVIAGAPFQFALGALLAGFAILFGARRVGLTDHNRGLVRAIAIESVVKLTALGAVAAFAVWLLLKDLPTAPVWLAPRLAAPPSVTPAFLTQILLSAAAVFCLPRQFHTGFVELEDTADMGAARWVLPLYLGLTCLAVVPLASAGLRLSGQAGSNPDLFVLALPFTHGLQSLTALVFIGGFSAATAMVLVETVALSAMASNQFILPWMPREWLSPQRDDGVQGVIIAARRGAIIAVLFVAVLYVRALNQQENLAAIGLISFAAAAQLAPALFGAVYWRRAHSSGAVAGIIGGFLGWATLLAIPQLLGAGAAYSQSVSAVLHHLTGLDGLTAGSLISLAVNVLAFVSFSLAARPAAVDLVQARAFVDKAAATTESGVGLGDEIGTLQSVVASFLGQKSARKGFEEIARSLDRKLSSSGQVDAAFALAVERMLAGAIGASSARGVIAEALSGGARRPRDVVRILDNAAQAVQFNRELLQATLDNLSQGVSVVDKDLRLVVWNSRFLQMFDLPPDLVHVGRPIGDLMHYLALRGIMGEGHVDDLVAVRMEPIRKRKHHRFERTLPNGAIIATQGAPMSNGGYLTTYSDITELRIALTGLAEANERLEARVAERTVELEAAKALAEAATASKTRFLAAASHDLLQPLHAARLFLAALEGDVVHQPGLKDLVSSADQSIDSAHRLLRALLNLSKLEAGGVRPEVRDFALAPLFADLSREFAAQAAAKGLRLRFARTSAHLRSDHDLVRSVLQNLIGNAIRYTPSGGVVVGARRSPAGWRLEVWDTGPGIPEGSQEAIFGAFTRMSGSGPGDGGVGLGLAIVRKVAEILDAPVDLKSVVGKGSRFCVTIQPAEVAPQATGKPISSSPVAHSGLRVLCIDNEPVILRGLRAVLERMGAQVSTASNEAQALAAEGEFDLALVDYHLDATNGLQLRPLLAHRVRRFVLVTADTSEEVAHEAALAGAELVHKPIRPDVLRGLLQRPSAE
jgi:Na+/proline symporter/signal transduction histidine kinase